MFLSEIVRFFMASPTCSNSCNNELPQINFNDCAPAVNYSEIRRIMMGKKDIPPFTDWKLATEWIARISSTSNEPDAIRVLTVIADKPAAAGVVKQISNGRRFVIGKDHTIPFTIDDVSQENYDFMRQLECGGQFKFWYETEGGFIFGGNEGIQAEMEANNVLGRGRDEIETILGSFFWRSKFHPERAPSPIFGSSTGDGDLDTTLNFAAQTTDADAGVNGTVTTADPDLKFSFNEITPRVGTPATMTLKIGATTVCVIDYPTDYNGKAFKFTSAAGDTYSGVFTSGNVTLS